MAKIYTKGGFYMENNVVNSNQVLYGYARVSTKEQNEDRQIEKFNEYGIEEGNIFVDKKTGADFERAEYKLLKQILKRTKSNENVLVIPSIDRLRKKL